MKNTKPIFYMSVGLVASGKSTWAETYKDELNAVIHSSDAIRAEFGNVNDQSKNTEVFEILHKRVKDDLRAGKNVIMDATNLSRKRRIHFIQNELRDIPCEKICVLFATPWELAVARNFARERQVPEGVLARMYKSFETPCLQEGWDDIQIVWADYKGLPGFEFDIGVDMDRWKKVDHQNIHHSKTIGNHMFAACDYIKDKTNDVRLITAALLHDCAKDICKSFYNSKGEYDPNIAHYYSHEHCGAMLSLFYLRNMYHEWSDKDLLYVSLLIDLHMRPHTSWRQSSKTKEKDRQLFGNDIIENLELLHLADLQAH
jgi:predicted kinase